MPHIMRQGIKLHYEEAGKGGPPLLFVHGFGGDWRHFSAQLEHFQPRRRVVALDRRGHGQSDKPEGPYGVPEIAEEVIWTAQELGLRKPVLVVHSMGSIGIELSRQAPDFLSGLVVLDAPLFAPAEVAQTFLQLAQGLRSPQYRDVIGQVCDRMIFLPTDDPTRRKQLHEAMLETPQPVLAASWQRFLEYDASAALSALRLPFLYVGAVMPCDELELKRVCPQVAIGRSVGSGHMHQLEVPDQVNAMIEQFLRINSI
ncbi:MAG TPA: alpha/beta hydrolase [Polyangiaceae bacterium]|nr:alpha/beta hydrolase [Polyangiaceae bacterium]